MEIILISVPYTGTNFTCKLFTDRGFQRVGMNERPMKGDVLRVAHCIKPTQIEPALAHVKTGLPLVLPCRHPFRCEESYRRKGDGGHIHIMIQAYETLITQFAPLTEYFMCVDSDKRESQLEKLNELTFVKTDWEVIASKSTTYRTELEDLTPSDEVKSLVDRHGDFFGQFYG